MKLQRSAGILLHPTSLPSGRLGDDAYAFVDWLAAAGQSWWQVLPLGPPDKVGSPYKSPSAFAAWPGLLAEPLAPVSTDEIEAFVATHAYWVGEWAAYAGAGAIADQVRFQREWTALRSYASSKRVRLIGDVPIYVAPGSADHRAHPELFQRGVVAGVPPDAFTRDGQLWANPLYDWNALRATGYGWWIERLRRTLELVDVTRIDHFRAFVAYWAVPSSRRTARTGSWRRGPGRELFDAIEAALGDLPLIAEDLGVITPAVERLRDELRLPGMRVMQWAFTEDARSPHRLENHRARGAVYTGTHDNDTARGWWDSLSAREREATGLDRGDPAWSLVELAYSSRAALAVVPLQDVLGLGSEARLNRPGTTTGNWRWRFRRGALTSELASRLRRAAERARRTTLRTS